MQVVDLANLHPGIDQYYRGHVRPDSSTARTARTKPLNLLHYTGSDRLGEVIMIIIMIMMITMIKYKRCSPSAPSTGPSSCL